MASSHDIALFETWADDLVRDFEQRLLGVGTKAS